MRTLDISQKLRKELEKELKPDRFDHTMGVAYTAASMAFVYGADVDKALIAGFLHDCAKCMSHEDQIKVCEKNNIEITDVERRNHSLLHAKVGMYLARTKYDIYDTDILNAIRNHVIGRLNMSLLEEIVFVSDFTEEGRTYEDCIKCREILLNKGIDEAIIYSYEATMNHIDGSNPHPLQIEVLKSYKEKIKNA